MNSTDLMEMYNFFLSEHSEEDAEKNAAIFTLACAVGRIASLLEKAIDLYETREAE